MVDIIPLDVTVAYVSVINKSMTIKCLMGRPEWGGLIGTPL